MHLQALDNIRREGINSGGMYQEYDDEVVPQALKRQVSVYEAGRALLAFITPGYDEISKVIANASCALTARGMCIVSSSISHKACRWLQILGPQLPIDEITLVQMVPRLLLLPLLMVLAGNSAACCDLQCSLVRSCRVMSRACCKNPCRPCNACDMPGSLPWASWLLNEGK